MADMSETQPGQSQAGQGGQHLSLRDALALANRQREGGHLREAEQLCNEILKKRPDHAGALHSLALVRFQGGDPERAITLARRAIEADASVALFHSNLCEMCRQAGRTDEAVAAGRAAIALRPDYAEAHSNLGIAHYDRDELDKAVTCYRRAIELRPGFAEAYSNLGNAMRGLGEYEQAESADAYANRGTSLQMLGRRREAMSCFARALVLNPQQGNAHSGRALVLLTEGDYEEGWKEYEWRWASSEMRPRPVPGRQWQGEDLNGKRLLVMAEQGYGDTIHFCRYLALLRERGATPILRVPPRLADLISESMPWLEVSAEAGPLPKYDFHSPLLSLPGVIGTRVDTIPGEVPYLRAKAAEVNGWQESLENDGRLKVGLAWGGNPKHANDMNRSIGLEQLAPVATTEGVHCFSLQVGERAADVEALPAGSITNPGDERLTPFSATAALIENLDLVICIDTSLAHLAGAMGKPLWLLLSRVADWRWLLDRDDSPWYPTARLFRQGADGQWGPVVELLVGELERLIDGDRSRLVPPGQSGRR